MFQLIELPRDVVVHIELMVVLVLIYLARLTFNYLPPRKLLMLKNKERIKQLLKERFPQDNNDNLFKHISYFLIMRYNYILIMKIINICLQLLIVCLMVGIGSAQQWYMPDSNMINEQQFKTKVLNDQSTFKIVKYFTPHCVYCRYLKNVVDPLKHQKEWCFQIYDLNCQWYPQHCSQNVRTGSFPYTSIHNGEGALIDQIPGFYPQPVIRNIFNRIEQQCLQYKKGRQIPIEQSKNSLSVQSHISQAETKLIQQPKKAQHANQINKQIPEAKPQPQKGQQANENERVKLQKQSLISELKQLIKQQAKKQIRQQLKRSMQQQAKKQKQQQNKQQKYRNSQIIAQNNKKQQKQQIKQQQKDQVFAKNHPTNIKQQQAGYTKYIFYAIALVASIYYFYSITQNSQTSFQNPELIIPKQAQFHMNADFANSKQGEYKSEPGQKQKGGNELEQTDLLAQIPDYQL